VTYTKDMDNEVTDNTCLDFEGTDGPEPTRAMAIPLTESQQRGEALGDAAQNRMAAMMM
jgi:hypothetical protein